MYECACECKGVGSFGKTRTIETVHLIATPCQIGKSDVSISFVSTFETDTTGEWVSTVNVPGMPKVTSIGPFAGINDRFRIVRTGMIANKHPNR